MKTFLIAILALISFNATAHRVEGETIIEVERWCPVDHKHYHDGRRFYFSHKIIEYDYIHPHSHHNFRNNQVKKKRLRNRYRFERHQNRANQRNRHHNRYHRSSVSCISNSSVRICF